MDPRVGAIMGIAAMGGYDINAHIQNKVNKLPKVDPNREPPIRSTPPRRSRYASRVDASQHASLVKLKRPNRNDPCPCGSGKKYKKCCITFSTRELVEKLNKANAALQEKRLKDIEEKTAADMAELTKKKESPSVFIASGNC